MFWMFVVLALGAGAYFGGEKVHRKWLVSRENKTRKQIETTIMAIDIETDAARRRPTEEEIKEAERELDEEFGWTNNTWG
jgi:hypothetical protein